LDKVMASFYQAVAAAGGGAAGAGPPAGRASKDGGGSKKSGCGQGRSLREGFQVCKGVHVCVCVHARAPGFQAPRPRLRDGFTGREKHGERGKRRERPWCAAACARSPTLVARSRYSGSSCCSKTTLLPPPPPPRREQRRHQKAQAQEGRRTAAARARAVAPSSWPCAAARSRPVLTSCVPRACAVACIPCAPASSGVTAVSLAPTAPPASLVESACVRSADVRHLRKRFELCLLAALRRAGIRRAGFRRRQRAGGAGGRGSLPQRDGHAGRQAADASAPRGRLRAPVPARAPPHPCAWLLCFSASALRTAHPFLRPGKIQSS